MGPIDLPWEAQDADLSPWLSGWGGGGKQPQLVLLHYPHVTLQEAEPLVFKLLSLDLNSAPSEENLILLFPTAVWGVVRSPALSHELRELVKVDCSSLSPCCSIRTGSGPI